MTNDVVVVGHALVKVACADSAKACAVRIACQDVAAAPWGMVELAATSDFAAGMHTHFAVHVLPSQANADAVENQESEHSWAELAIERLNFEGLAVADTGDLSFAESPAVDAALQSAVRVVEHRP